MYFIWGGFIMKKLFYGVFSLVIVLTISFTIFTIAHNSSDAVIETATVMGVDGAWEEFWRPIEEYRAAMALNSPDLETDAAMSLLDSANLM